MVTIAYKEQKTSSEEKRNVVENVAENVVINVIENEKRIVELIRDNKRYSALEMAGLLGLTQRTVQRYLKQLQEKGSIERVGSAKGGHWKVHS